MAMLLSRLFVHIIDYVYSLYFCLRIFPFRLAIKTPINISHNVKIEHVYKGSIELSEPIFHNKVFIGHQGYSAIADQQGLFNIERGSKLIIEGKARFAQGIRLWIENGTSVKIGDNFYCNKNCLFRASDDITIGRDVLMGWDIAMNTTDGHRIKIDDQYKQNHGPIVISDNVWIGSHVIISKNVEISEGSVVAQQSLVISKFVNPRILIAGCPAKEIKSDIKWSL